MSLSIPELFKACGIDVAEVRRQSPDDRKKASRYYGYVTDTGGHILVESTATSVMDEVTRLSVAHQTRLFAAIVAALPNPGDQQVLEGDEKRRGARVVRLACADPASIVELLITH